MRFPVEIYPNHDALESPEKYVLVNRTLSSRCITGYGTVGAKCFSYLQKKVRGCVALDRKMKQIGVLLVAGEGDLSKEVGASGMRKLVNLGS